MNKQVKIAWIGKHFGEEPPLVRGKGPESKGKKQGAGTIFFSGCNLRCVFCQNYQIPQQGLGRLISVEEFTGKARLISIWSPRPCGRIKSLRPLRSRAAKVCVCRLCGIQTVMKRFR